MMSLPISTEGLAFVDSLRTARTISGDQARLLVEQAEANLNDDPYWPEYPNVWDNAEGVEKVYLVAAYYKSRRYGGPEEGGWWYTHYEPLTDGYAQHWERAFIHLGPFKDRDEAREVANDLQAFEDIGVGDANIEWRVVDHVPYEARRAVYC